MINTKLLKVVKSVRPQLQSHSFLPFIGFSIEPVNTTAKIAFPARLDCQPTNPDAFIRWTVSGSLAINKDTCPGCQILTNGSLYISSVMSSHANRYTCFIPAGSDMFTVYLTVAGKFALEFLC